MRFSIREGDGFRHFIPLPNGCAQFRTDIEPTEEDWEFIRSNLERFLRENSPKKGGAK